MRCFTFLLWFYDYCWHDLIFLFMLLVYSMLFSQIFQSFFHFLSAPNSSNSLLFCNHTLPYNKSTVHIDFLPNSNNVLPTKHIIKMLSKNSHLYINNYHYSIFRPGLEWMLSTYSSSPWRSTGPKIWLYRPNVSQKFFSLLLW